MILVADSELIFASVIAASAMCAVPMAASAMCAWLIAFGPIIAAPTGVCSHWLLVRMYWRAITPSTRTCHSAPSGRPAASATLGSTTATVIRPSEVTAMSWASCASWVAPAAAVLAWSISTCADAI